jgi:hypothetical protein
MMNAKLNVLEQVMDMAPARRTKAAAILATPRDLETRVRVRRSALRPTPAPAESLWRVTIAETRDAVAERALTWSPMAAGLAALGWLAYSGIRFLLAWEGLVSWVRAAIV